MEGRHNPAEYSRFNYDDSNCFEIRITSINAS